MRQLRPLWLTLVIACLVQPIVSPHRVDAASVSRQAAALQATSSNLIRDGGFEQEGENWEACGGVSLVDAQEFGNEVVYGGRYAVAMGAGADSSGCADFQLPNLTPPKQVLRQQLSIPANAPAVTVSFWFRAVAGTAVDVFLARSIYQFDPNLGGVKLGSFSTERPPGWQLYRTVLTGEQLDRVRGKNLAFAIVIQGDTAVSDVALLLIDDVQVIAADGRTQAAPLPPALRGDGSRPLAFIRREGEARRLYRMDTDGGNRRLIYSGLLGDVRYPAWSFDGRRIAVVDHNLVNGLQASAVTVLNADGSGARQEHQTQSRPGSRCPFFGPGQEEPALIVRANHLTWMPDNRRVAFTSVAFNRFCNNRIQGGVANLLVTTGQPAEFPPLLADFATRPSSNRAGRILFDSFATTSNNRARGIWEVNTGVQPPQVTHLLPVAGDSQPVWAPDGRRFAVVRDTVSPSEDASERVSALMIYERARLNLPRQALFADHGRRIDSISWSPDGAYLVYTLERADGSTDIWWLDVNRGTTGPVTRDGVSFEAAWRPQAGRIHIPFLQH